MAFIQHDMQALIVTTPKLAKERILSELKSSGVHMGNAAAELGCSHATLLRWIAKLDLTATVAAMKTKAIKDGWYEGHKGGRPQGTSVANGAAPRGSKTKPSERSDGFVRTR